jgi:hypothetical protein
MTSDDQHEITLPKALVEEIKSLAKRENLSIDSIISRSIQNAFDSLPKDQTNASANGISDDRVNVSDRPHTKSQIRLILNLE